MHKEPQITINEDVHFCTKGLGLMNREEARKRATELVEKMTVEEIARRSGAGTRTNLYFIYERDLNTSPTARRNTLRKPGELNRYKIIEAK